MVAVGRFVMRRRSGTLSALKVTASGTVSRPGVGDGCLDHLQTAAR
jgi:hypothetical protein